MTTPTIKEVSLDDALALLRAELKREFPQTKFSINRARGTAYGYVHVRWTDGPTEREVSAITSMYEGQGFDGMTDSSYSIEHVAADGEGSPIRVRFGTRGISTSRAISADLANRCIKQVAEFWGGVEAMPVAEQGSYFFKLTPDIGRLPVRADLGHDRDWYTEIHRCAARPDEYVRKGV